MTNKFSDSQHQAIMSALFEGRKIEAIKLYREATGVGLAEAKSFVEGLEARLREENPGKFSVGSGKSGCGFMVLVLLLSPAGLLAISRCLWP